MSSKILFSQRKIAELAGMSQQMVSYVLKGDRQPSIEMAERLEKATGICREGWLWPERHFNPYIPFADVMVCVTCPNRIDRIKMANKIGRRIFRETKSFDAVSEVSTVYNGVKNHQIGFRWREIKDGKFYLLNKPDLLKYPGAVVLTKKELGMFFDIIMKRGYATLEWRPPTTVLQYDEGYRYLARFGIRSAILTAGRKRRLLWSLINYETEMLFTKEMIDEMLDQTGRVEEMWLADQE